MSSRPKAATTSSLILVAASCCVISATMTNGRSHPIIAISSAAFLRRSSRWATVARRHPFFGKHLRDRAAEADAGTGDKRDLAGEPEIHGFPLFATPRKADLAWTVLARILSFAKDRGIITSNPCERGGRLYVADRRDKIWTEQNIAAVLSVGSPERSSWRWSWLCGADKGKATCCGCPGRPTRALTFAFASRREVGASQCLPAVLCELYSTPQKVGDPLS
ncbi:hypothetical protein ACVWWP_003012 [Bradyrhizobium sp. LM3.6]